MPRISLIHATPLAIEPVNSAFAEQWPDAEVYNLLDDSLAPDLTKSGRINVAITERFKNLAHYSKEAGADAILFTCSAFGPAIEQAAKIVTPLITLKPNEAMFREAIFAYQRIGMIATFQPSVPSMQKEFEQMVEDAGQSVKLEVVLAEGAMEQLAQGNVEKHNDLIKEAAKKLMHCDAIMLAQFSMAKASFGISEIYEGPVLTSPSSAITALKEALN